MKSELPRLSDLSIELVKPSIILISIPSSSTTAMSFPLREIQKLPRFFFSEKGEIYFTTSALRNWTLSS